MAPGSPSTSQRRTKRVSAQHTLERVRNNQRRHRARRKDYIATLEQKLADAEQTISTLGDQVEALQAALTQCRHHPDHQNEAGCLTPQPQQPQRHGSTSPPPLTNNHGEAFQASSVFSDTEDLGPGGLPAPASSKPLVSDDQPGLELDAVITPPVQSPRSLISLVQSSEFILETLLDTEPASYQAVAETGSLLPATVISDQILTPTTPCCSSNASSDAQNTADRTALVPSQGPTVLMPGFQPAMEVYYQATTYGESTMLCSEADLLIAQQNFNGMSREDVAIWLWNGFRRPLQPGGGCRVNTDILFTLLAFIRDT
ncbi:hypothetical protein QQZ08_005247 [Neonectria magnoliae]|uniref:BZIP domain-containing protein n=1 Tax=Neonectria magnoliae TaxID=2732573 RepID=A0ABR1I4A7_9HYPO